MFKDYYRILGVSQQASASELKSAYRAMSIKWHPDRNPGVDVTSIMQDINEAYAILKDESKRCRYDEEYSKFIMQSHEQSPRGREKDVNADSSWNWEYNYDIQDETLKEDIKAAKQYAEELVNQFLRSFKDVSGNAVKGAWSGAKGYICIAILMAIIGGLVKMCYSVSCTDNISSVRSYNPTDGEDVKSSVPIKVLSPFAAPESWIKYAIDAGSFSISVPNTVELRHEYDNYTRQLKELGFVCNSDRLVFQQKGLSDKKSDAYNHYCRIIVAYVKGNEGDFLRSSETERIDYETELFLKDLVMSELGGYKLLGEPKYEWIGIGVVKAIEIKYKRSGSKGNTTACTMYLLFNCDEMVKMIVSYREREKDIWLPDLDNVIRTFRWN